MTFLEQYILVHSNGGRLDFEHIDQMLENFGVSIPTNHLEQLTDINQIIEYIYKKVIAEVTEELEIINPKYSLECNSRASYLSIQDDEGVWNNVHSREELKEILQSLKDEIAT